MTYAEAITSFQRDVEPLELDGFNPHFKTRFATLTNVVRTLAEALPDYNLAWNQWTEVSDDGCPVIVTEPYWLDPDSGKLECGPRSRLQMPKGKAQDIGTSITYGRRYSLVLAFGLCGEDDNDGSQGSLEKLEKQFKKLTKGLEAEEVAARLDRLGVDQFKDLDYSVAEMVVDKLKQAVKSAKAKLDVDLGEE